MRPLLALLALLPLATAHATVEFTGDILVALEGPRTDLRTLTERRPQALLRVPGSRVMPLFDTEAPRTRRAAASAAPPAPRRWVAVSGERARLAIAQPRGAGDGWDLAHRVVDGDVTVGYGELGRTLRGPGERVRIVEVEPDLHYTNERDGEAFAAAAGGTRRGSASATPGQVTVDGAPSDQWPFARRFGWHLEDGYSQLSAARAEVGGIEGNRERVTIAHLDTGYGEGSIGRPPHLETDASYDFTTPSPDGLPAPGAKDCCRPTLLPACGHGTGTLSILAGNKVSISADGYPAFDDYLGAAPQARVVEYRISDSVVHLWPRAMATAIEFASTHGVDVISMSMGGAPSGPLRDAVNDAYARGTALFTAAGNYYEVPLLGLRSPAGTVYPAAFDRVVAVTGITEDGNSYSKGPPLWWLLRGEWSSWMMRGNSGPPWAMPEAIAAYAPNVEWMIFADQGDGDHIRLNGAGTSAAAPQVAGAAALWLDRHRPELVADWREWRKTEAVYRAILDSAGRTSHGCDYDAKFFGAGVLRARDALGKGVAPDLHERPAAAIDLEQIVEVLFHVPSALAAEEAEDRRAVHRAMLGTEIAQLVSGSVELQKILDGRTPDELASDRGALRRFARALRRDPDASEYLRSALHEP